MIFLAISKAEHWSECCDHRNEAIRRYYNRDCQSGSRNATPAYRVQCEDCGAFRRGIRKDKMPQGWSESDFEVFDEALKQRISDEYYEGMVGRPPEGFMGVDYDKYLRTPWWKEKRSKVLRRAGGMCEGCGDRSAT